MPTENQKTDFSFITDQPGPDLAKPKSSKKPLIIIGGIAALFLLLIIIAISKKSTNVQQTVAGQPEAKQFLTYIADKDTANALSMYEEGDRPDEASFSKSTVENFGSKIDFRLCDFRESLGNVNNGGQEVVVFRCPLYSDPANKYVDFYLGFKQTIDGTLKLKTFMVKEIKQ